MRKPDLAAGANSVFAGQDVCEVADLRLDPEARRPIYDDDVWDLSGLLDAHRMMRGGERVWDFTQITNPTWRPVLKDIALAFLAPQHERVISLPLAFRRVRSPRTVAQYLREWTLWMNWLSSRDVDSLSHVTQDLCNDYLSERSWSVRPNPDGPQRVSTSYLANIVKSVQVLRFYGDLFTVDRYDPLFIPWEGQNADTVAGNNRGGENSTPQLPLDILQPLLANCLYLIDTVGPHIPELLKMQRADQFEIQSVRRGHNPARHLTAEHMSRIDRVLGDYFAARSPLPKLDEGYIRQRLQAGWDEDDPLVNVHIGRILLQAGIRAELSAVISQLRPTLEHAASEVGIDGPWARDAPLIPHAQTGVLVPLTTPLTSNELYQLASHVLGSCMVLTAAVTGMRRSELMEIDKGCRRVSEGPAGRRYRVAAKLIKGQALGGVPDEWVVIEEVDRALALAEELARTEAGESLFGGANIGSFATQFRRWTAGPSGQLLGLEPIPEGPINARMLRRTLSMELAKRPGGVLAAKIHLKHVSVVTTEGYAERPGGSQAAFLGEIEQEEHAHHLELTIAAFTDYRAGQMPSGPGARELINVFQHVDDRLTDDTAEPVVINNERRLENLLRQQADVLHIGPANYCWFRDPSKALCLRLAGQTDASRPLVGMCDSARCPQATHHLHHRPVWETAARTTQTMLGNPRVPKAERPRLQAELDRAIRVVNAISESSGPRDEPS